MKNTISVSMAGLIAGLAVTLLSVPAMAQTSQTQAQAQQKLQVPSDLEQPRRIIEADDGSGLQVEELRFKDRLGEVSVQHGEDGVREYYDMNNTDEIYQDGSLIERGASRTWRLGGGR